MQTEAKSSIPKRTIQPTYFTPIDNLERMERQIKRHRSIAEAIILTLALTTSAAFLPVSALSIRTSPNHSVTSPTSTQILSSVMETGEVDAVEDLKSQVLTSIEPTKRGLSASAEQQSEVEAKIRAVEASCPLLEPARDSRMEGGWEVLYTTAPPPSNGQLGPFVGVAKQKIDLLGGGYQNVLQVGGGDNPWLSAVLDATWTEWDGTLLVDKGGGDKWRDAVVELDNENNDIDVRIKSEEGTKSSLPLLDNFLSMLGGLNNDSKATPDYGATSWKVDFKTLSIRLFGVELFQQTFPEDTARVWKMTYLDDDTRIVRAGRTGNAKDDVVFYMIRDDTL